MNTQTETKQMEIHERLVTKYIEEYFKDKPNSTGLNKIHSDMGHPGVHKSVAQINLQFSCIPRCVVEYHIKTCSICNLRQKQTAQPRLKSIESSDVLDRVQIVLVDMQQRPIDEFYWICHTVDHFSKFHIIHVFPLKRKCGQEVGDGIRSRVLAY